jgi:hypothetical protein
MSSDILNGNYRVSYNAENGQKRISHIGSATSKNTLNQLYSAIQDLFDEPAQMDDLVPMKADTPDIYRMQNQWFIDDKSVEHLTGGSLFSDKWIDGTTEHVLIIGYNPSGVEFDEADIGRTILGATTGDVGTILDFNTDRNLLWIRPVDPLTAGDEFDNGTEAYSIGVAANGDPVADATQEDNDGGPSFVNQTADANEGTGGDVECFPATSATDDAFYVGFAQKFSRLMFDRAGGTQGSGGTIAYEYWNGTAWVALSTVVDDTSSAGVFGNAVLADNDELTFDVPTDWATTSVDSGAQLYYIRVRVTSGYTTEPIMDQVWISGVGAGVFATHNRHGVGSKAGESSWAGLTSIASVEPNTHLYISQEDPDRINQENLVVSTKGSADWWDDGDIDILLKVKEGDSVFGPLPASSPVTAVATAFARQYSKSSSHFIATGLNTTGGNTVIPLSAGDDLDNPTGYRNQVWDLGSSEPLVDEELLYVVGNLDTGNLDAGVQEEDGVGFTDDTVDINDAGGADVLPFPDPESINDAFYFGKDNIFQFLLTDIATQGVSSAGATIWEYWDGAAWQTLTVVDDSDSGNGAFTEVTGRHLTSWTPPADWARTNVTNQPAAAPTNLYYVRVRVTAANYSVMPVLDVGFVGGELQLKARVADTGIVTPGDPTGNADYYLLGDPIVDLVNDDVVIAGTSRKTFDVNGAPTNVGPAADTDITATHGAILVDVTEDGSTEPYSIDINNASNKTVSEMYERFKFLTRRGETASASTDGQEGQFYIGDELQVEYNTQSGAFTEGSKVYDQTNEAEGIVVADHDDGATGDVILRTVRGTFGVGNVLSDSPDPSQVMATDSFCVNFDQTGPAIVDQSADALSAGVGDVQIVPGTQATGDYFMVGARKPFARVVFDNTGGTAGTVGDVIWEYWNGTAWVSLEGVPGFVDGTSEFTAGLGVQNLDFSPPADWQPRGLSDGTFNSQTLFMIRARIDTTIYTIPPVYDTVAVQDLATATIGSVRSIAPVVSAPFGTFPGASKFFFAPGASPLPSEMAPADVQAFQTIDDDGNTNVPPNKQAMTVTNLIAPDSVAVFRRVALVINKTQLTLAAGNNEGDAIITVDATIPVDNPNTANSKLRVISASGDEHRYRYASFTAAIFTLATASTGTADGGSTNTNLFDAAADFVTDGVEVGDFVRNTADGVFARVIDVVDLNTLTTEDAGFTWDAKTYSVNTLVENYGLQSAYVPLIERIADAGLESNTITFLGPLDVRIEVRSAGVILPFSQDSQIISTGLSIAAIRNVDDIFN